MSKKHDDLERQWEELRPRLAKVWALWDELYFGSQEETMGLWEPQEKELFLSRPGLYREWRIGLTPAQERGFARMALVDMVLKHRQRFGLPAVIKDLEECLRVQILREAKGGKA